MPPREGLPGLETSLPFSAEPLHHVFIVIHGAGDPYVDHQPWLSSLETCINQLQRNYNLVADHMRKAAQRCPPSNPPPAAMFLPVEWHRPAFDTWQAEVRHADLRPSMPGAPTSVRDAVAETVGDVLLMASPFWRRCIARHIAAQITAQLNAVRRNRPAFTGRVSLVAHSIGAMLALELLHCDLLRNLQLDSVVLAGCPVAAYAALAPNNGQQTAIATIRARKGDLRFINVFHPLDPVAYRLEPFVLEEGEGLRPAIRVTPQKRTFWDDATMFWDDVVYNLWSTLFPGRGARRRRRAGGGQGVTQNGIADLFSIFGGNQRGNAEVDAKEEGEGQVQNKAEEEGPELRGKTECGEGASGWKIGMQRSSSYVVLSDEARREDGEEQEGIEAAAKQGGGGGETHSSTGGSEVLLSDRIDYELQDGMGVPPLDVMASWGAIKAHTYYWQSLDVAQMLLDIVVTSDDAMASR